MYVVLQTANGSILIVIKWRTIRIDSLFFVPSSSALARTFDFNEKK